MTEPVLTSYDEMPYTNKAFPQTHPDRLAALATLFGLKPPGLDTCRVLELGCASGGNLIPMAVELPNARFVGVDLSARQINEGQRQVNALGLTNIELRQYNIADIDASWGNFDYILSHGIYSWVPAAVREKILAICRDNLSVNGVAYISYNTLPGWHTRGAIRDMMLYHSTTFPNNTTKVQQSRWLIDFLAQSTSATTPYGMALRQELDAVKPVADAYLFHEYLEDINDPFYFHQFAEAARGHGLEYLCEADFGQMLELKFSQEVTETLQRIASDIIQVEQYMDFVSNRLFRQTLLVHQGAPIRRNIDGLSLKGLLVGSAAQPLAEPMLAEGVPQSFRTPSGKTHVIADALTKAAQVLLAKQWPLYLPFEELAAMCLASGRQSGGAAMPEENERSFGDRLLQGYGVGAIELRVASPRLTRVPSARPVGSPIARLQAEHSLTVTNLLHEPVMLNELPRCMLLLLDGTRDIDALVEGVVKSAKEGKFPVRERKGGPAITHDAALKRILRRAVEMNLPKLAQVALLME